MSFPSEKMPVQYDRSILTRAMENVHSQMDSIESVAKARADGLQADIAGVVTGLEKLTEQGPGNNRTPMPVPTNVIVSVIPIVGVFFITCDPIDIAKYPNVLGYQFFIDPDPNFTPLIEPTKKDDPFNAGETLISGNKVTFTGTCDNDSAGSGPSNTEMWVDITESTDYPGVYIDIPFWSNMNLNTQGAIITNKTKLKSATMGASAWSHLTPNKITASLADGAEWEDGDIYSFAIDMPSNLVAQGFLPFAVYWPFGYWGLNQKWDGITVYAKVRTFGIDGVSEWSEATNATQLGEDFDKPIVTATPWLWLNKIGVTWESNYGKLQADKNFKKWKVYRRTDTTTPAESDLIASIPGDAFFYFHDDFAYDPIFNPDGIIQGTTYYYWVRAVNIDDKDQPLSDYDSAVIGPPNTAVYYDDKPSGEPAWGFQDWEVQWTVPGGAEGAFIRNRTDWSPLWSLPTNVAWETTNGVDGSGNYIQRARIGGLVDGQNYIFEVNPYNNNLQPLMWSAAPYLEIAVSPVTSGLIPDPPT